MINPLSGDVPTSTHFRPNDIRPRSSNTIPTELMLRLRSLSGIAATISDALDELGWRLVVPRASLEPRTGGASLVVGPAITLAYLPERQVGAPLKLAYAALLELAQPGDIMVVDAVGCGPISTMGGVGAALATRAGVIAAIVDGGVRDLGQIELAGLPVWSRYVTPISGRARLEATSINAPVMCGGVQVHPGDLVVADETGICFLPQDITDRVLKAVVERGEAEREKIGRPH